MSICIKRKAGAVALAFFMPMCDTALNIAARCFTLTVF